MINEIKFYDDSILPGTKTQESIEELADAFYDDSILPGTKTYTLWKVGIA